MYLSIDLLMLRSLVLVLLILFAVLVLFNFVPRSYHSPNFQTRENTQYWDLPTGSNIGYTKLEGLGEKKPYPVVYLHGGPGGAVSDVTINALRDLTKDGYDLFFYDQVGSGHSSRLDRIAEYTVDRHVADLFAILKNIGVDKVILIGQSWGALLATQFIAEHPTNVVKLIVTGPGPILPIHFELAQVVPPDSLNLEPPQHSNREGNLKTQNIRTKMMKIWAYIFGNKLATDAEADDYATYLFSEVNKSTTRDSQTAKKATSGAGYYAHIMTVQSFGDVIDKRAQLKTSDIQVLVMKGQYDNQKWGFTSEYLTIFKNSKLTTFPDCGHFIEFENPTEYLIEIRRFLGYD